MKTLCLNVGYNGDMTGSTPTGVTTSTIRMLVQKAAGMGIDSFDDGYYYGWINPIIVRDILNNCCFDGLIDIYIDKPSSEVSDGTMRLGGIRFRQTVGINDIYLFGKNSDIRDVETIYWEKR